MGRFSITIMALLKMKMVGSISKTVRLISTKTMSLRVPSRVITPGGTLRAAR